MEVGSVLGNRYIVEGELGSGGLATAFRVRDRVLDVEVALKLVGRDPASIATLRREFLALRGVVHPRLSRVHDFGYWRAAGDAKTRAFYTSAIVRGVDLATFARGRSWEEIAPAIADVLSALASLHRRGILHGDVHPGNILVGDDGRSVLVDLSCCRSLGETVTDEISGTPGFIAPELLRGVVDRTADLYALGKAIASLACRGAPRAASQLAAERPEDRPATIEEAAVLLGVSFSPPIATDLLRSALVGRAASLAELRSVFDNVVSGTVGPRVATVIGAEGVGLTRFLEEAKVEAQLRMGAMLVPGRAASAITSALGLDADAGASAIVAAVADLGARRDPTALVFDGAHELGAADRERLGVLLRSVPPSGSLAVVIGSRNDEGAPDGALAIELGPLGERDVRTWLRAEIPESALGEIVRATGGYPKEIAALLTQLDGSAWDSRTIERAARSAGTGAEAIDVSSLDHDARSALALVAASMPLLPAAVTAALGVGGQLDELARRGLVVRDPDGDRLLRRSDEARIARALGATAIAGAHAKLAEHAKRGADEGAPARWIAHLARSGEDAGEALTEASRTAASRAALRPAADAVVDVLNVGRAVRAKDREVLLACAEIYAEAGEPARALTLVARLLASRPPVESRAELRALAGRCYALIGDSRRAVAILRRALPRLVPGGQEHAGVAAALSLALLKRGADAEASAVAREALDGDALADTQTRLDLVLNAVFATSRSGDAAAARALLRRAQGMLDGAPARGRFRLASATAFVEYRAGGASAALAAYRESLRIAEEHGLDDLVASAALNYGTACHQEGDLGRALDAYTKGQRLARALGMPTTEATLSFNLAKVYADIGSRERAQREAETARRQARREGMGTLEAGACAVLAELASSAGDHATSSRLLGEAEALVQREGGTREALELGVQRIRSELVAGDLGAADRRLRGLDLDAAEGARDAEASLLGARAAFAIADSRASDAIEILERAVTLASESGRRGLVAELEGLLADAYGVAGSTFLAERHLGRARELWERTLSTLPQELHDAFRRHPARAKVFAPPKVEAAAPQVSPVIDVRRILEINRRLNSATTTNAVLEETMDAAISLTSAERGFLLAGTPLRVAIARNFDRENLRQGHLKFSRTVAERVVRSGDPVIAVDAAFDPRFSKARSVHALRLKSLLCVPIRSPEGVLGAIYVDHRFSAGGFRSELIDVLLALGDQAALAMVKARLVDELRAKTKELEERNAEVERLARGQAIEIARLKRSMDEVKPAAETPRRFDYGTMVAGSPAMKRVLAVVDRVIDADVTVLLRGESGTGKERVARAVHDNSGRSRGPFVAINCGALPETLLEAELFGYRKGAFSGAVSDRVGLFVAAKGGTLFLDELGEMPPAMQVKLLRVLQEREVRPLGGADAVSTDVRLVCATNRILAEEVRAGRFREDLYYRVAVVEIELPPLRERIEDVLPLAEAILERLATELGRPRAALDRGAERALLAHGWPGNVRELENVLTKAFLLARSNVLGEADLSLGETTAGASRKPGAALRARIVATLEETDWNVVTASRLLGMPRATMYRKMRRLGIARPPTRSD